MSTNQSEEVRLTPAAMIIIEEKNTLIGHFLPKTNKRDGIPVYKISDLLEAEKQIIKAADDIKAKMAVCLDSRMRDYEKRHVAAFDGWIEHFIKNYGMKCGKATDLPREMFADIASVIKHYNPSHRVFGKPLIEVVMHGESRELSEFQDYFNNPETVIRKLAANDYGIYDVDKLTHLCKCYAYVVSCADSMRFRTTKRHKKSKD
jgi:hypothetical protein